MKQKIKQTLMAIVGLFLSTTAFSHDFEVNGIYYYITNSTNKTVEVTYRGSYSSDYSNEYTGSVTIPSSVTYSGTTYSVTSISYAAFSGCTGLTSVTIPNSVTTIGYDAFYNCTGLTSVTIPNSVTTIRDGAFYYCTGLTSVTIPNSVTTIGDGAFYYCYRLTSVTIGNSVTSIGDDAFYNCTGLTSVTIGNSVTSIGDDAFYNCTGLTSVNITDLSAWCKIDFFDYSVNPLYYAKMLKLNGTEITNLVIPNDITEIKNYAFYNCDGLTSVTIPNSVTTIGSSAFSSCSGLTSITIPNSVTTIGTSAFYGCSGLTSVTIPNSVTSISDYAFYGCSNLKFICNLSKLTLSKGSSSYGYLAYYASYVINAPNGFIDGDFVWNIADNINTLIAYCGNASKLILPIDFNGDIYKIGDYAFYYCTGLTSVTIPNSVSSIGNYAFDGCTGLTELIIEDGKETLSLGYNLYSDSSIGKGLFYYCPLEKLYLGRNLNYESGQWYGYSPFYSKNIKSVTFGSAILSIDENLISPPIKTIWLTNTPPTGYKYAEGVVNYVSNDLYTELIDKTVYPYLSSIFEVDGVMYVPVSPSERTCDALDCTYENNIDSINIGKTVLFKGIAMNVKNVNPYTFYRNNYLKDLTIDTLFAGTIGNHAVWGCKNLKGIDIPNLVTEVGANCFEQCDSLKFAIIGNSVPAINDNTFAGCYSLTDITIPKNVATVGNYAFDGCKAMTNVFIADRNTILELGSNGNEPMFSDCPLDSVYIGGNISYSYADSCGYSPFYRNTSLRAVKITDKETEVSENEFYGCTNLKYVSIGNGVESIGNWAFSGCSSLDYFAFGTSMKTIGEEAFSDCTAVTKLYSQASTPPVCGTQALDDINKWTCELYVPGESIPAYQAADQWKEFFFMYVGVEGVKIDCNAIEVSRYDIHGRLLSEPARGINIIKMSDGTTRKEIVKE